MADYSCPRCRERTKDWVGSDPKCGFNADGTFVTLNWNCATLNVLRQAAEEGRNEPLWHDDSNVVVLPAPENEDGSGGNFIILRWYKRRGRTDAALWWGPGVLPVPITLAQAERFLSTPGWY